MTETRCTPGIAGGAPGFTTACKEFADRPTELHAASGPVGFIMRRTAAARSSDSGEYRVPLLELYTSEGCDSCPPADRWLSALPARGYGTDRVVALAFHVDYWNYLVWAIRLPGEVSANARIRLHRAIRRAWFIRRNSS